ncbi:diacylglycerol kinase [Thalassotalea crassostreae]|uniref:diacylglycerol kinase n=1 Tax=Thalassotalea crassostreae TaxID=1763536 RepID=UPI0008399079
MSEEAKTNKVNGHGLGRIIKATHCSMKGFKAAWINEAAFRQETIMALICLPFSFILASSVLHWLVLIFALLFVVFAELVNSALEALADKVCLEHDVLIGRTKDIGSAIVFVALSFMTLVWICAVLSYFNLLNF